MKLSWGQKHKVLYYEQTENDDSVSPVWLDFTHFEDINHHQMIPGKKFGHTPQNNRLIQGDNLFALHLLIQEYQTNPDLNKIKCVYIDPPYNTGMVFRQYDDQFEHAEWLGLMYMRLKLLRNLLADDGTIFIQLNDTEQPYLETIMDDIFGKKNKLGTIIWRRRQSQANLIKTVSTIHDYILVYAKDQTKITNSQISSQLWTEPKKYGHNHMASKEIARYFGKQTLFDTPKPELLIYHILKLATRPGDWILDCFAGSGTTLATAHKMHRYWIGIELIPSSCDLIQERLIKVISTQIKTKVDKLSQWGGGGGFQRFQVKRGNKHE